MKKLLMLLCIGVMGVALWKWWEAQAPAPGALLLAEPAQGIAFGVPFKIRSHTIFTMASFQVDARVLGVKTYQGDEESAVSPADLALGWGPMSDQKVLADVSISQSGRFYYWQTSHARIGREDLIRSSANIHVIPASAAIREFVETVHPGELISLKGRLVSVHGPGGWSWTSSLTRDDTGAGACEVFYVEQASRIEPPELAAKVEQHGSRAKTTPIPQPVKAQPTAAVVAKTVTLSRPMTVKLKYGSLTIPAGATISVIEQRAGKLKGTYGGHEFWLDANAQPQS